MPSETKMILCLTKLTLVFNFFTGTKGSQQLQKIAKAKWPLPFPRGEINPEVITNLSGKNPTMCVETFGKPDSLHASSADQSLSLRHLIIFSNAINTVPSKTSAVSF